MKKFWHILSRGIVIQNVLVFEYKLKRTFDVESNPLYGEGSWNLHSSFEKRENAERVLKDLQENQRHV